ncbi:malto-oligosyltrehalose synthase [Bradyrhizobium sp. LHD-71]|uniref:malto-oligosyltrehalose synthase n=1 Tax=Bradyrhizobium sp. LHD-71 TaxID=3072141 RepID=UPI00280E5A2D|nr:malto-oligosyltrehalose synthase [Bradyrhizobium sp. LHD-71]MDQ8727700.1 malto-oligosyltrehalose synthase [Bradyrhizobium sp. LHD-71]
MTTALATYRLQLTKDFGFEPAAAVVPYLKALGITHVYASPFTRARSGSTHGYDVVDHTAFNPELGGEAGFEKLSAALKANSLGLILDFVPNHMGVHYSDNDWWLDILEWGPKSRYAKSFDIDWDMLPHRRKPGLLLPILGVSYGEALNKGQIELRYAAGKFSAYYYEHKLPIAPQRYSEILRVIVAAAQASHTAAGAALLEVAERYSGPNNPDQRAAPRLEQELAQIAGGDAVIAEGLEAFRAPNGPAQVTALHHLLERQHYRLSHWRLASSDINYRRFFDINSLAGLRIEDGETFERVHALVHRLIAEDKLQGLRIDHIDGLHDPVQYLQRLRRLIRKAQGASPRPFILLIEKILGEDETLQGFEACDGTTGYEWLNQFSQVLMFPQGQDELKEIWRQASNLAPAFEPVLIEAKRRVLETLLVSEFTVLTRLLARIAAGHHSTRDYSEDSLRQALTLFVLHFPVYRTYIRGRSVSSSDRETIEQAIRKAQAEWFAADDGIFDFLRDALTLDLLLPGRALHSRARVRRFASKVQQFTGPLMAKSLEDTAFYRYPLLLALNEVGGNPAAPAMPLATFHANMAERARQWPKGLTATATHDTKRGEDARMRILAVAELAGDWGGAIGQWKTQNARFVTQARGQRCPSLVDEYMIYQALIGAWPLDGITSDFVARFQQYVQKAIREEKLQSSWLNPNSDYEEGIRAFVARILDASAAPGFLDSFALFARRAALLGALNSLSQLTLKATVPGVPDFYQGTELWDLSLVDPDNRRPVDFPARAGRLSAIRQKPLMFADTWEDGTIKLAWTRHLLELRQRYSNVFALGGYIPLAVQGPHAEHVIAFTRHYRDQACSVVALRHFAPFTRDGGASPDFSMLNARISIDAMELDVGQLLGDIPAVVYPHHAGLTKTVRNDRALSRA